MQSRLFELAVAFAENAGSGLGELYGYAPQRLFSSQPTTLAGLFGVATFAGDLETAGALAKSAQGDVRSTLLAALDVANGVFAEEHAFVPPKKDEPIGRRETTSGAAATGSRARRRSRCRRAYCARGQSQDCRVQVLIRLAEGADRACARPTIGVRETRLRIKCHTDCLDGLLRAIFAVWADDSSVVALSPIPVERYADYFRDAGQHWLAAQYRACLTRPAAGGQVNIF